MIWLMFQATHVWMTEINNGGYPGYLKVGITRYGFSSSYTRDVGLFWGDVEIDFKSGKSDEGNFEIVFRREFIESCGSYWGKWSGSLCQL